MEEKDQIISRLVKNTAEIITEDELRSRLDSGESLTHYIGFEISGHVHLGTGIMASLVMKDLAALGVKCTVWLADWHSWINGKLDGTKETAAKMGQGYFTEAMKASYMAVGGNPDDLEFRLASEWYAKDAFRYLSIEKTVELQTTLSRMQRSISIAGKKEGDSVSFATLTYPAMQVADVFYQDIAIAHAGMDQRKAHVVMRDVSDAVTGGKPKPIAIHHPLLQSLNGKDKEDKMSKSDPDSAIFIHDSVEDIERKIKGAFAPEKEVEHNPVLNWAKNMLFWNRMTPFVVTRAEKHGGDMKFPDYEELEKAYAAGDLHPMDLKSAVTSELIGLLAPAREHFAKPEVAAMKKELDEVLANK